MITFTDKLINLYRSSYRSNFSLIDKQTEITIRQTLSKKYTNSIIRIEAVPSLSIDWGDPHITIDYIIEISKIGKKMFNKMLSEGIINKIGEIIYRNGYDEFIDKTDIEDLNKWKKLSMTTKITINKENIDSYRLNPKLFNKHLNELFSNLVRMQKN